MSNELNKFDEFLKQQLEETEYAYDPAQWNALESKLGSSKRPSFTKRNWLIAAGIAALVGTGVIVLLSQSSSDERTNENENPSVEVSENGSTKEPTENIQEQIEQPSPIEQDETVENNPLNEVDLTAESPTDVQSASGDEEDSASSPVISEPNKTNETGTNEMTLSNENGSDPDDEEARVNPTTHVTSASAFEPTIKIEHDKCPGGLTKVSVISEENAEVTINWGDGNESFQNDAVHRYRNAGEYTIHVTVNSENSESYVETKNVQVLPSVEGTLTLQDPINEYRPWYEFETDASTELELSALNPNKAVIKSEGDRAHVIFKSKGTHEIPYTVTDDHGCVHEHTVQVTTGHAYNLGAPNAMKPNSADQRVNSFMPSALRESGLEFTLYIYDKNTQAIVFETSDPYNAWDGRRNDGNMAAPLEFYVWKVELTNEYGDKETYMGHLTIYE